MLPYTPLHHLLLADVGEPLVMTSGNVSDEPIAYEDDDALERLARHRRRASCSTTGRSRRGPTTRVLRIARGRALPLRRSRGYVPSVLALPVAAAAPRCSRAAPSSRARSASPAAAAPGSSHHIGDLKNVETLGSFATGIEHFERLFAVAPEVVAHDLHPDYLSTTYALEREGVERVGVQHHHAHLAACLAEHGETGPAVGAIFDGTGLRQRRDGVGRRDPRRRPRGFERAAHLWPVAAAGRRPRGPRAVADGVRLADARPAATPAPLAGGVDAGALARGRAVAETGLGSPVDDQRRAACSTPSPRSAALRREVTYEGQAAIELEAACDPRERGAYPLRCEADGVLDARDAIRAVARDLARGRRRRRDRRALPRRRWPTPRRAPARRGRARRLEAVVLSGGVFQNRLLLERTRRARWRRAGLRVLVPERLPPNDGGIATARRRSPAARG